MLHGLREAEKQGFTHALTMDADGQHPADLIPRFQRDLAGQSRRAGTGYVPVFDDAAPRLRVGGRKISNWWANLETLWAGIGD